MRVTVTYSVDLENVRGNIKSDTRDTIYIVSDYAQYNSINFFRLR